MITMKDTIERLNCIIVNETKSIETMRHSLKEDELTILRLQNKLRALEKDIGVRKQLIKEYRDYLGNMSKSTHTRTKLIPARVRHLDTDPSITRIKSVRRLEKKA
jgi:uncharacterized coiled-coil protein SlyX